MKNLFSILLLFFITIATGCSSEIDNLSKGSISGSVSDATTGDPVPTVNVTLKPGGASTVTGSDGAFSFTNLAEGEYTIEISKEGYKSNDKKVSVKYGDPTSAHLLIERIPAIVTTDRNVLDFGDNLSHNTLSFNIVNSTYEDLAWEIEERCDWITEVKPDKGVLKYGKTEGIVVTIDRGKLATGENKSVIVIRSTNGSSQINVIANIEDPNGPKLNILDPTNVTSLSATFNAEIIQEGTPSYTERGFVYSLEPYPSLDNSIAVLTCPVNSNKTFTANALGLTPSQNYYVRAYARYSKGVVYSANEIKFSTSAPFPQVTTSEITDYDLSNGTATFRGNITYAGIPPYTERGFVYATFSGPTVNDNKIVANGAGESGTYSVYATNLPTTTYYVRAYAISALGTVYGEQKKVEKKEWIDLPEAGIAVQTEDLGIASLIDAIRMCKNSRVGGFDDWHLPTLDELMIIYNLRDRIGGFNFAQSYWSSEDVGSSNGMVVSFSNGNTRMWLKSYDFGVRAVRTLK